MSLKNQITKKFREVLVNEFARLNKQINVLFNNPYSLQREDLPVVCIVKEFEDVSKTTLGYPASQDRQLVLKVFILCISSVNVDDKVDEIVEIIENVYSKNKLLGTQGKQIEDLTYSNIQYDFFEDIDTKCAGATIDFYIKYSCDEDKTGEQLI